MMSNITPARNCRVKQCEKQRAEMWRGPKTLKAFHTEAQGSAAGRTLGLTNNEPPEPWKRSTDGRAVSNCNRDLRGECGETLTGAKLEPCGRLGASCERGWSCRLILRQDQYFG
jgi:hypothetical protein